MKNRIRLFLLSFISALAAPGQSFSSGSTGADGALDLSSADKVVPLPSNGILNYTTVNIPGGRTLTFSRNLSNAPVIMLATGTINVAGTIDVSGSGTAPGPGGFYGGDPTLPGLGPGGGKTIGTPGEWVGPLSLVPIIGGSGGAGGLAFCDGGSNNVAGGGGGGAIVLASSSGITVSGTIAANGGAGGSYICDFIPQSGVGPHGSSGAVRLVANSINVSGSVSSAIVRLEGAPGQVSYTGSGTAPVISAINSLITPLHPPSITIVSIGGYPVPSYSGSSFSTIDLLLPTQLPDPIAVVVQGTNVPVGSPVTVNFSGSPGGSSTTATLAGTSASSTATVQISNLNRSAITFLFVSATFDPTLIAQNVQTNGPDALFKVELAIAPGERTQYRFLRRDGSQIPLEKVSAELRRALGL